MTEEMNEKEIEASEEYTQEKGLPKNRKDGGMERAGRPRIRQMTVWILVFVFLCVFFWIVPRQLSSLCDDAFISFRYAKHLEQGKGLVFNPGEPVEGYTNLLWTLLLAGGARIGFPLPQFAVALSALSGALLILSLALFSKSYFKDMPLPYVSFVAPALLILSPFYLEHLHTGLETTFFTLLTFLSMAVWLIHERRPHFPYLTGILLGLAYLTRPEAALWVAGFVAMDLLWALLKRDKISKPLPTIAKYISVFALIASVHMAWRVSYYGAWLPNTYYVKAMSNWAWGVLRTKDFLWSTGFLPLIAVCIGPLMIRKKWVLCMSAIISVLFVHNLRVGGDFILTGRFLVPLLPLIFITIQELTRMALTNLRNSAGVSLSRRLIPLTCLMAFLALYAAGGLREWASVRESTQELRNQVAFNEWAANCIKMNTSPTDTIAVVAAGVIPYYAERNTIDMLGLNDEHIAHNGIIDKKCFIGHQRTDSDYILDRKPEIILIPRKKKVNRAIAAEYYMSQNPRFLELYRPTSIQCGSGTLRIYRRRD